MTPAQWDIIQKWREQRDKLRDARRVKQSKLDYSRKKEKKASSKRDDLKQKATYKIEQRPQAPTVPSRKTLTQRNRRAAQKLEKTKQQIHDRDGMCL